MVTLSSSSSELKVHFAIALHLLASISHLLHTPQHTLVSCPFAGPKLAHSGSFSQILCTDAFKQPFCFSEPILCGLLVVCSEEHTVLLRTQLHVPISKFCNCRQKQTKHDTYEGFKAFLGRLNTQYPTQNVTNCFRQAGRPTSRIAYPVGHLSFFNSANHCNSLFS